MIVGDVFLSRKEASAEEMGGILWLKLNQIDSPKFLTKDERGVRDRWVLIWWKFTSKIREEEVAHTKRELCHQQLDIKQKEQEKQQETMQAMMLQQQRMNQA